MIWAAASVLLLVAAPFVLWPLLSHWAPEVEGAGEADPEEARRREREELELDS